MRKQSEIQTAFAPREALNGRASFFLVGIGGAGMSGIARMLQRRGFSVRGTDSTASATTAELETYGIGIKIGHSGEGIREEDAVVLSDAIDLDSSPEVAKARELGCPLFRRSQVLGWLLRGKKVIAITGTHGKTTTTGMVGAGLRAAGLDPTIVVGANVPEFEGAVIEGTGDYAVVEACEAYDSFHDLDPFIVVLTNLELDHVDFHGNYENLRASVWRFVSHIPSDGCLIYCEEDKGAVDVAQRFEGRKLGYSLREIFGMSLPGRHNALNASGAWTAASVVLADPAQAVAGIAEFRGAERRLQVLRDGPITVVDDYAHHPAEIRASIQALRDRYAGRRLVVVYQPHLYSRTAGLIPEFAEALSGADLIVLTDIYPAREAPMPGISSARIAELLEKPVRYVPNRHLLPRLVHDLAQPGDVIVGMGAGNIDAFAPAFIREIDRGSSPTKKVAVIYGGDSAEREVSLHSGLAIHAALQRKGYESKLYDVTEMLLSRGDLSAFTGPNRPDVAVFAVHGTNAEDGAIQGLFELLHIPYIGSGIQSSALAMDKRLTKQILEAEGLPVPRGVMLTSRSESVPPEFKPPLIVKPNAQGSTVGLSFVERQEDLQAAIDKAFQYDTAVLVEDWIQGMEISVPVMGDKALLPVEIAPVSGKYDFAAKYTPGATEEIVPARITPEETRTSQEYALRAHRALGCEGATRTDMIVDRGRLVVLEVNTLPGMTGTSLLPNSAQAMGISFEELVDWMVQDALKRHEAKT